jgi:hypothetical protein
MLIRGDMAKSKLTILSILGSIAFGALGCASTPAKPFDTMPQSQVTVYRLNNAETPAAAQPAPGALPGPAGMIPGLPPQVQTWFKGGADGLGGLFGGIPGLGGAIPNPAAPPAAQNVPKFHNFSILASQQVTDQDTLKDLSNLLGSDGNFASSQGNCMYPEFGVSFTNGGPANDLLISHSCRKIQATTFAWPHPNAGIKPKTAQSLADIWKKIWPS